MTVNVTIHIPLTLDVPKGTSHADLMRALANLADVMGVQAEDGLYSLGSPEAENDEGPSELVAHLTRGTEAVTIEG